MSTLISRIQYVWTIYWPIWTAPMAAACLVGLLLLLLRAIWLLRQGRTTVFRSLCSVLVFLWVFLVIASTLFSRSHYTVRLYHLQPLWTFAQYLHSGNPGFYLKQIVLNLCLLLPVGLLLPASDLLPSRARRCSVVVLCGFLLSLFIELSQLIFRLGYAETDDLLHNTLGVLLGYGLYRLLAALSQRLFRRR